MGGVQVEDPPAPLFAKALGPGGPSQRVEDFSEGWPQGTPFVGALEGGHKARPYGHSRHSVGAPPVGMGGTVFSGPTHLNPFPTALQAWGEQNRTISKRFLCFRAQAYGTPNRDARHP